MSARASRASPAFPCARGTPCRTPSRLSALVPWCPAPHPGNPVCFPTLTPHRVSQGASPFSQSGSRPAPRLLKRKGVSDHLTTAAINPLASTIRKTGLIGVWTGQEPVQALGAVPGARGGCGARHAGPAARERPVTARHRLAPLGAPPAPWRPPEQTRGSRRCPPRAADRHFRLRCRHFAVRQHRAETPGCCPLLVSRSPGLGRATSSARPCRPASRPTPLTEGEESQAGSGVGWGTLVPAEGALRRAAVGLGRPRLTLASPRHSVRVCLPLRAPLCRERGAARGRAGLGFALGWALPWAERPAGPCSSWRVFLHVRVASGTLGLPEILRVKISTFRSPQGCFFIVAQETQVMVILLASKPVTGLKAILS